VFALEADSSAESGHFSSEALPSPAYSGGERDKGTTASGPSRGVAQRRPGSPDDTDVSGPGDGGQIPRPGHTEENRAGVEEQADPVVPTQPVVAEGGPSSRGKVTSKEDLPLLLTVEQAAAVLHTTPKAVYAMVERGILPGATRVGRRLLIRRDDLLDSLGGSRAPSPKEVWR
jgi:excisionase family DNA binding protein